MQQSRTIGKQDQVKVRLGWKGDALGIMQEIKFSPYYEIVYAQKKNPP